jgi:uncharacterized protein YidB (DUF937 family)
MGILDSLENNPAFKSALSQLGAAVLPVVMGQIMGTGSQGGLSAIVAKLEQAGFGDQVKSWIGTESAHHGRSAEAGAGQRHRQTACCEVQHSD